MGMPTSFLAIFAYRRSKQVQCTADIKSGMENEVKVPGEMLGEIPVQIDMQEDVDAWKIRTWEIVQDLRFLVATPEGQFHDLCRRDADEMSTLVLPIDCPDESLCSLVNF